MTYTSYGDHNIVVQYLSAADAQTTPATYDIQPAPPPIVSHVAGDPYIVSPGSNASFQWAASFEWHERVAVPSPILTGNHQLSPSEMP